MVSLYSPQCLKQTMLSNPMTNLLASASQRKMSDKSEHSLAIQISLTRLLRQLHPVSMDTPTSRLHARSLFSVESAKPPLECITFVVISTYCSLVIPVLLNLRSSSMWRRQHTEQSLPPVREPVQLVSQPVYVAIQ